MAQRIFFLLGIGSPYEVPSDRFPQRIFEERLLCIRRGAPLQGVSGGRTAAAPKAVHSRMTPTRSDDDDDGWKNARPSC